MTAAVSVLAGCGSRTGLLGGTSTSELDGGASGQSIAAARLDDELRRQRGRLKQFLRHERFRRQWRQLERFQFEQQFRIEQLDGVHAHGHAVPGHGRRDVRVERPVGDGGGARRASELHDKRWGGGVHLQRRRDLHGLGERVRDDVHLGDLRDGRAGVLLRVSIDAVQQRRMQCRSVLHQRVHDRSRSVRDGRARDVRDAIQRVHRLGNCGGVPGGYAVLQRRSMHGDAGESA